MILSTELQQEFHENGKLAYANTIAILSKISEHLYPAARSHPDGYSWIRIGNHAKFYENGQLAWEINYDNFGNVISEPLKSFRKDGTFI